MDAQSELPTTVTGWLLFQLVYVTDSPVTHRNVWSDPISDNPIQARVLPPDRPATKLFSPDVENVTRWGVLPPQHLGRDAMVVFAAVQVVVGDVTNKYL